MNLLPVSVAHAVNIVGFSGATFTNAPNAGAVFLTVIGLMQYYTRQITGVQTFSLVGGTSLLIVVGVALDTMQSLESHLVMRNYEGFIKQAR